MGQFQSSLPVRSRGSMRSMHSPVSTNDVEVNLTNYKRCRNSFVATAPEARQRLTSANAGDKQGFLEFNEDGSYRNRYFILRRQKKHLEYYNEDPNKYEDVNPLGYIDIAYVTKVVATPATKKDKKEHRFEICTPSENFQVAAFSDKDRDRWIEIIKRAAVNPVLIKSAKALARQSFDRSLSCSCDELSKDVGGISYQTAIVGGVPVKTAVSGALSSSQRSASEVTSTQSIRLVKEGWCSKQGAVMKNWKRRYFRLNVIRLSYSENNVVPKPIRAINAIDIRGVRILNLFANRKNIVEVETPYRKFYMQPENEADVKLWKRAIEEVMEANGTKIPRTKSI